MTPEDKPQPAQNLPSKGFVALLYLPLLVPALLPLYFASEQDDPALIAIMLGMTAAILIFNAVILVTAYRWLTRAEEP